MKFRAIAAALALLAALFLLQACGGNGDAENPGDTSDNGSVEISDDILDDPRLEVYDDELVTESQAHVPPTTDVPYVTVPPYGGPHDNIPLGCGIYTTPPRFENAVHAMEHGAVVIWYAPRLLNDDQQAELESIARAQLQDSVYTILAPYAAMSVPIMLVTWGERMPLEQVEASTIEAYIDEFKHDAPEPTAAGGCRTAT